MLEGKLNLTLFNLTENLLLCELSPGWLVVVAQFEHSYIISWKWRDRRTYSSVKEL